MSGGGVPRKRFGQHFLHDAGVIEQIVAAVDPRPGERLVEIGPGRGALTRPLLARCGRLHAIELDRDLVPRLRTAMADEGEFVLHEGDALAFDYAALAREYPGAGGLRLVGNLPYNISTPILFHLLRFHTYIADMHFMLQKEVVARMAAGPGSKAYGRLSVMLAQRCRIEALFDIGPEAFTPPPRVVSSIVRIEVPETPLFEVRDEGAFAALVRQAFSMRRKTLRNSLRDMVRPDDMLALGVDPGLRPEQLAPEDFARLAGHCHANPG